MSSIDVNGFIGAYNSFLNNIGNWNSNDPNDRQALVASAAALGAAIASLMDNPIVKEAGGVVGVAANLAALQADLNSYNSAVRLDDVSGQTSALLGIATAGIALLLTAATAPIPGVDEVTPLLGSIAIYSQTTSTTFSTLKLLYDAGVGIQNFLGEGEKNLRDNIQQNFDFYNLLNSSSLGTRVPIQLAFNDTNGTVSDATGFLSNGLAALGPIYGGGSDQTDLLPSSNIIDQAFNGFDLSNATNVNFDSATPGVTYGEGNAGLSNAQGVNFDNAAPGPTYGSGTNNPGSADQPARSFTDALFSGASSVWNLIKSAGQYVADSIITPANAETNPANTVNSNLAGQFGTSDWPADGLPGQIGDTAFPQIPQIPQVSIPDGDATLGGGDIGAPQPPPDLPAPPDLLPPADPEPDTYGTGSPAGYYSGYAPVVLDLTGKGIKITPLGSSNHFFDMSGDGYTNRTAWAGPGNGVLVFDPTGSHKITSPMQFEFTRWDPTAKSDMQALEDWSAPTAPGIPRSACSARAPRAIGIMCSIRRRWS
jgi:hypothetical protein